MKALIVVGGVLQIAGVALVFFDVRRIRIRVAAYLHRPQTIFGSPAVMLAEAKSGGFGSTGRTPTVEERVQAVETRLASMPDEWKRDDERVLRAAGIAASSRVESVARKARADIDDLAALVLDLQPAKWWCNLTLIGAVLIVVGVALATVGSLP